MKSLVGALPWKLELQRSWSLLSGLSRIYLASCVSLVFLTALADFLVTNRLPLPTSLPNDLIFKISCAPGISKVESRLITVNEFFADLHKTFYDRVGTSRADCLS